MELWRCFSWDGKSNSGSNFGEPLYVPLNLQGQGRYDVIKSKGVFYASLQKESALAEYLKAYRGESISQNNLTTGYGLMKALVLINLPESDIVDLRDVKQLEKYKIKPAQVLSQDREITQKISQEMFDKLKDGLLYWSPLKSEWTNAALFISRIKNKLKIETITKVNIDMVDLQKAANYIGVKIIN